MMYHVRSFPGKPHRNRAHMIHHRQDEAYHLKLVLETGDQRTAAAAPVATQTLPGETPADHHARQGQCQSPRQ